MAVQMQFDAFKGDPAVGWNKFLSSRSELLRDSAPSGEMLKRLHRIMTGHCKFEVTPEVASRELYTLDRPAGDPVSRGISQEAARMQSEGYDATSIYVTLADVFLESCMGNTTIEIDISNMSKLRSYGSRKIRNRPAEHVMASTFQAFGGNTQDVKNAAGNPRAQFLVLFHITTGLPELYASWCSVSDALLGRATTLDEALRAEAVFQSSRAILHPFLDGNTRAYTAHLAYTLARFGVFVEKFDQAFLEKYHRLASDSQKQVMRAGGSTCIVGDHALLMGLVDDVRRPYMAKTRAALQGVINNTGAQAGILAHTANQHFWVAKQWLIETGLVKPTAEEQEAIKAVGILNGLWTRRPELLATAYAQSSGVITASGLQQLGFSSSDVDLFFRQHALNERLLLVTEETEACLGQEGRLTADAKGKIAAFFSEARDIPGVRERLDELIAEQSH